MNIFLLTLTVWTSARWGQNPSNSSAAAELPRGGHPSQSLWSNPHICRERYSRLPNANPGIFFLFACFCILRASDMFKTATLNSYCDEYHHVLVLYPHICLFVSYLITLQVSSLLHWFIHAYRHSGLCGTILHFSVHWLPLLLGDENKVSLLGLGALDPLRQLIAHNNKLVRRNAFMALGIMATSGESGNIWNQWKLLSFFCTIQYNHCDWYFHLQTSFLSIHLLDRPLTDLRDFLTG